MHMDNIELYCDTSTGVPRPYVPSNFRRALFSQLHELSHPGGRASVHLVCSRFVWPNMKKDIKLWVRQCHKCQISKVHKHERSPLVHFLVPDERFAHVHIDIVGPLPSSKGYTYLLTCIDRFTRWFEAIPLTDQSAEIVAQAFFNGWISRFGTPVYLVTDQGRNFLSFLFKEVSALLGIELKHTTAYHPQANGLIERCHRTLKAALMCRIDFSTGSWFNELHVVLLGLRTMFREDIQTSSANLVYGTSLRLPGEFFDSSIVSTPISDYAKKLHSVFERLRPKQTAWHTQLKSFCHPDLDKCTHVYLRRDGVKLGLQRPYSGPYQVLSRSKKTIKLLIGSREVVVSRDRVKPAFTTETGESDEITPPPQPDSVPLPLEPLLPPPSSAPLVPLPLVPSAPPLVPPPVPTSPVLQQVPGTPGTSVPSSSSSARPVTGPQNPPLVQSGSPVAVPLKSPKKVTFGPIRAAKPKRHALQDASYTVGSPVPTSASQQSIVKSPKPEMLSAKHFP
ncbi:uncharacterized protein LOC103515183 [Diaphorina citri]|uniref:Uncharacterized protein LOC103515183 n=1 Tax=Diaphorina citri TaxID=121845 RepID=A0A1S4EIJ7_DIACI|nr:uncharacterized protein LOC103515183 [Diaphorina citri]